MFSVKTQHCGNMKYLDTKANPDFLSIHVRYTLYMLRCFLKSYCLKGNHVNSFYICRTVFIISSIRGVLRVDFIHNK